MLCCKPPNTFKKGLQPLCNSASLRLQSCDMRSWCLAVSLKYRCVAGAANYTARSLCNAQKCSSCKK
eukprot:9521-Heterococcus_DN1.PRE.2